MSDNNFVFAGLLPMRRVIVGVFILAALLAGVAGGRTGEVTAAESGRGGMFTHADLDGDTWHCVRSTSEADCSRVAGALGGPVEQLGYPSAELAGRECQAGQVIELRRQYQLVGYSCLIGGR